MSAVSGLLYQRDTPEGHTRGAHQRDTPEGHTRGTQQRDHQRDTTSERHTRVELVRGYFITLKTLIALIIVKHLKKF